MKTASERRVLENVPRIAFAPIHDGKWEFTPFPSCLKSCLTYMNRPKPYHYLLGVSGAAFRLVWHSGRWDGGNVDIIFMDTDPLKPLRNAFVGAGSDCTIRLNSTVGWKRSPEFDRGLDEYLQPYFENDESVFLEAIVESIDRGVPVIALGVVGPPEASIITGYDDSGATLIGWSMYIEKLLSDDEYPADQPEVLAERGNGGMYIEDIASHYAFAGVKVELAAAAAAFKESASQMEGWWKVVGQIWSDEEAQVRAVADPEIRRAFVPYVERSRDKDAEAVEAIEAALGRL